MGIIKIQEKVKKVVKKQNKNGVDYIIIYCLCIN